MEIKEYSLQMQLLDNIYTKCVDLAIARWNNQQN